MDNKEVKGLGRITIKRATHLNSNQKSERESYRRDIREHKRKEAVL